MASWRWIFVFLSILFLAGKYVKSVKAQHCPDELERIPVDVPVRLIFAGHTPLFMRTKEWRMEALAKKLNSVAASSAWRTPATLLEVAACPIVYYKYKYTALFASEYSSASLDRALKSALQKAHGELSPLELLADRRLSAESLGDEFESVLSNKAKDARTYNVLIYSPIFASSEANYGYIGAADGKLGTMGMSNRKRFLFLDVNARPLAYERNTEPTPGELMFTVSRNMTAYSHELHGFLFRKLTPPVHASPQVLRTADVINFKTFLVDANSIVVQERLLEPSTKEGHIPQRKAPGEQLVHPVFNQSRFENLVNSVFKERAFKSMYRIHFSEANTEVEDFLIMALSRAIHASGNEVIVNGQCLADDSVAWFSDLFSQESDPGLTIPIFVFTFADNTRKIHFDDGAQAYAVSENKTAIFVLQNRASSSIFRSTDAVIACARKAVQVLFSMQAETLALPGTKNNAFSRTVLDIAAKNYVATELQYSASTAVEHAISALNYTGFDDMAIAHLSADFIEARRSMVRRKLKALFRESRQFIEKLDKKQLRFRAAELLAANRDLSEKMVEVVCQKLIADDILRDVRAAKNLVTPNMFSLFLIFVALSGFAVGSRGISDITFRVLRRKAVFELPQQAPTQATSEQSFGQWFSTLHSSKSKRS